MHRIIRTSLTTIGLTAIALAALAGGRAQSADTDLQPTLQQIRDEVRDLRHDVKALRELLEKQPPPAVPSPAFPVPNVTKQPDIPAVIGDGAYFVYSRSDIQSQLMVPTIDQLRAEGYAITKIDVAEDIRQKYGVDADPIEFHPLLILKHGQDSIVMRGLTREVMVRSTVAKFFAQLAGASANASAERGHYHFVTTPAEAYFFYAKWSGPCQQMMLLIDKLCAEGHAIVKVDIDNNKALARQFNVTTVPTLIHEVFNEEDVPLQGVQTEEKLRGELSRRITRPEFKRTGGAHAPAGQRAKDATPVAGSPVSGLPASPPRPHAAVAAPVLKHGGNSPEQKPNPANESKTQNPPPEAYFFYSKHCLPCQQMMPIIDKLRAEGHRIEKVDMDADQGVAKGFNVTVVPTLWLVAFAPQFVPSAGRHIEVLVAQYSPLVGLHTEDEIRTQLNRRAKGLFHPDGEIGDQTQVAAPAGSGTPAVGLPPFDPAAAGLPDCKIVQIKNYIESIAGESGAALGRKMTGNEMIASVDGQSVFASEIFQRAGAEPLTPDGMSLAKATKSLAAGQIEERYYRELQLLALRKFSQKFLNTRGWAQAMIASLDKSKREKTETAITDEFNRYVQKLEKDFNVATAFDVDKKLREQGTSLLGLKAEFRDRLLADEFVRGKAQKLAAAAALSQTGGDDLQRHVTVDCDERPLSEVLDLIFRDQPIVDFYKHPFGTFKCPIIRPIVCYLPAVQNEMPLAARFPTVAAYLDAKCPQRITLHIKDVPVSVALRRVFEQTPLDYWMQNGVLRIDSRADKRLHRALERKVTFDCDKLALKHFIRLIKDEWQLGDVIISGNVDLEAPITLHVADTKVVSLLTEACRQAQVRWEFRSGRLDLSPAVNGSTKDRWIGELIGKRDREPEGKLITKIVVEGNSTIPTSTILKKLKITAGHEASSLAIGADVRTLWLTGWFNTVESRLRPDEKGTGEVLVFVVVERPDIRKSQGKGNPPNEGKVGNVVPPRTSVLDIPLIISEEEELLAAPKDPMVLLCYPVADLLLAYPPADLLTGAGAPANAGRPEKYDFNSLEKLIRTVVGPGYWEGAGGKGKIAHDSKSLTLVIRQTQSVHDQIRNLLQQLRQPQPFEFTLQPILFPNGSDPLVGGLAANAPAKSQATTLLTKEECDRIAKAIGSSSLPIPGVTSNVGIDVVWQPFPGESIWPEKIQAISGQIGGRAYIWFELTGKDPGTGEPHREGLMSLSPDFKPVLIPLRLLPSQKHKEWPLGPQRTVDEWAKSPDREFLLIRPVVEYTEAALDHKAAKEHDPAKAPQKNDRKAAVAAEPKDTSRRTEALSHASICHHDPDCDCLRNPAGCGRRRQGTAPGAGGAAQRGRAAGPSPRLAAVASNRVGIIAAS